ncbi:O-antigen ligase family protein [Endozoicomonas sp. Mp262]|uniref:O-antigen ligase family protein n=1 Tax=Endozoicomonas sp. Mp262 TaxID=2919499 RepID=UPI0021DA981A
MAFGAFFKPGPLAVFFSAAALMSLFLAGTKKNLSLVYIALMVVFFVCTIITQSRSGLLMFASGAIAYLLLERSQKSLLIFLVVTALCTLSLATIYFYNPDPILDLWERKDAQRFLIYQNGFSMITESPLTTVIGHGLAIDKLIPYSSHFETHIHMLYMNIVFQTGLIGLLLFLFAVGWRFYNIIFKRTPYNSWDIILIGMLVAFLFDGNKFYVYPGGTMAAFLLPLFITNLVPERIMADKVKF